MTILLLTFTLSCIMDSQAPAGSPAKQNKNKAEMILKEAIAGTSKVPSQSCWPDFIPKLGKRLSAQTKLVR